MNNDLTKYMKDLQAPFPAEDIEWKTQVLGFSGGGSPYVLAVPYVTNRAIQARLDEVFGVFGWENQFQPAPGNSGFLCGITIRLGDKSVTKWDGAENTSIEPLKGGISNSMKRAAVQLGIGRYLYDLPEFFAECTESQSKKHAYGNVSRDKKTKKLIAWKNPVLPDWAQPGVDIAFYVEQINQAEDPEVLRQQFAEAFNAARINQNNEAAEKFKSVYEARKQFFMDQAAQNISEDTEVIRSWAEGQAKSYRMVTNIAALESMHQSLLRGLADKCKHKMVDQEQLADIFITAFNSRKQEMESEQGA